MSKQALEGCEGGDPIASPDLGDVNDGETTDFGIEGAPIVIGDVIGGCNKGDVTYPGTGKDPMSTLALDVGAVGNAKDLGVEGPMTSSAIEDRRGFGDTGKEFICGLG